MTERFSNFDDDEGDSGFGTSSIASNGTESYGTRGKRSNREQRGPSTGPESSFDDFDSEWNSDASPGPGAPSRSGNTPLISNNAASSSSRVASTNARALSGGSEDFGNFEVQKPLDRERNRSVGLDNDHDSQLESFRGGSRGEADKKASTGLQLRDFSLTPITDDSLRPRSNGSSRNEDSDSRSSRHDDQMPPMPQVQYEPFSIEPSSHYQNYLYLLKYIHGLKIMCGIHLLYVILAIVFKIWYMMGGLIVAPFGFFAVHHLNRKMIVIWCGLFALDTLAETIGALVMVAKPSEEGGGLVPMFVHLVVVCLRAGLTYLIYRFWSKLPENAAEYFAIFTSAPEPEPSEAV